MPHAVSSVVATALSNVVHLHIRGTVVTTVAHRVKTHAKTAPVKAAAGKTGVVTTAMRPVQHLAVQPATNLPAAPNNLAPATSSPMLRAKALPANVAAPAC